MERSNQTQKLHAEKIIELEKLCKELNDELCKWRDGRNKENEAEGDKGDDVKTQKENEVKLGEEAPNHSEEEEDVSKVVETLLEGEEEFFNNQENENGDGDNLERELEGKEDSTQKEEEEKSQYEEDEVRKTVGNSMAFCAKRTANTGSTMKGKFGSFNNNKKHSKTKGSFPKKRRFLGPCTGNPFVPQEGNLEENIITDEVGDSSSRTISGGIEMGAEILTKEKLKEIRARKEYEEANSTMEIGSQVGVVFNVDTSTVIEKLVEMEKRSGANTN